MIEARKQLEFLPSTGGGKWHIRNLSGVAVCDGRIVVPRGDGFIVGGTHPICCRKCAKIGV